MRRSRFVLWFVGVVICAVFSGCGGSTVVRSYEDASRRKQEIHMLWAQIREWRQEAGLKGVEPPRAEIIKMHGKAVEPAVCTGEVLPRCEDMCSLAEAICENAESICRIAGDLAGDSWAQDKCASAKASCEEAKQACCDCASG